MGSGRHSGGRRHCPIAAGSDPLALSRRYGGDRRSREAKLRRNLGVTYGSLGQYRQARIELETALAIDETIHDPQHPEVGTDLSALGNVLLDLGDLTRAREHFERALAISEAAYGPSHPEVATDRTNLASVLRELGDLGRRPRSTRAGPYYR